MRFETQERLRSARNARYSADPEFAATLREDNRRRWHAMTAEQRAVLNVKRRLRRAGRPDSRDARLAWEEKNKAKRSAQKRALYLKSQAVRRLPGFVETIHYRSPQARLNRIEKKARKKALRLGVRVERVDYGIALMASCGICSLCGRTFDKADKIEFDHAQPLASGGGHIQGNVQVAHEVCNRRKWKRAA